MKFVSTYSFGDKKPISLGEIVEGKARESYHGEGQLETLDSNVRAIANILKVIVEHLPDETQTAIAKELGYEPEEEDGGF